MARGYSGIALRTSFVTSSYAYDELTRVATSDAGEQQSEIYLVPHTFYNYLLLFFVHDAGVTCDLCTLVLHSRPPNLELLPNKKEPKKKNKKERPKLRGIIDSERPGWIEWEDAAQSRNPIVALQAPASQIERHLPSICSTSPTAPVLTASGWPGTGRTPPSQMYMRSLRSSVRGAWGR